MVLRICCVVVLILCGLLSVTLRALAVDKTLYAFDIGGGGAVMVLNGLDYVVSDVFGTGGLKFRVEISALLSAGVGVDWLTGGVVDVCFVLLDFAVMLSMGVGLGMLSLLIIG